MTAINLYYKCRDGSEYTMVTKEELMRIIDPYNPDSYLPYLEAMNYPYFEEEWINLRKYLENKGGKEYTKYTLGKYIAKMNLWSYKSFTWEDNEHIIEIRKEKLLEAKKMEDNKLILEKLDKIIKFLDKILEELECR